MLTLCQYLQNVSVIERKSAQTINPEAMRPIANIWRTVGERISGATLVYGGNERQKRGGLSAIGLDMIREMID
jgi:hypothetical protein